MKSMNESKRMKRNILLLAMTWQCLATTPAPYNSQRADVDRVCEAARIGSPTASMALEILVRIAEARMDSASPDAEVRVGLRQGQLRGPDFRDSSVRSHALRKIAESDMPEALAYLERLTPARL